MELNKNLKKWGYKISSGDIFEIPQNNQKKAFFQFLFKDEFYMSGHLIRAFNLKIDYDKTIDLNELVKSEIKFHTYTRVLQGLRDKLWVKIGNIYLPNDFHAPFLRRTPDVGKPISVSKNWIILLPGTDYEKFVGELDDETRKIDIARIFPPFAIVKWLETGWHGFKILE